VKESTAGASEPRATWTGAVDQTEQRTPGHGMEVVKRRGAGGFSLDESLVLIASVGRREDKSRTSEKEGGQ